MTTREELLQELTGLTDRVRTQLTGLREQVRTAKNLVDVPDSMAEAIQHDIDELYQLFDEGYNLMERCDAAMPADDPDYLGLRVRLIDDFRSFNVTVAEFQRLLEPETEREAGEEPEEEAEEEEAPEEEAEPEEEPEAEPEEEPAPDDRKARQAKLARERREREAAAHAAAVSSAEAEAQRRQAMEDTSRIDTGSEERLREEAQRRQAAEEAMCREAPVQDGHDTASTEHLREEAMRREQDERLAREAEDKAHREAMTREPEVKQEPVYGYTGPDIGPAYGPRPAEAEDTRPRYSRGLHEELVEKYRQREEDISYDRPENTVGKEQGSGSGGYAPAGYEPSPRPDAGPAQDGSVSGFRMPPPPLRYTVPRQDGGPEEPGHVSDRGFTPEQGYVPSASDRGFSPELGYVPSTPDRGFSPDKGYVSHEPEPAGRHAVPPVFGQDISHMVQGDGHTLSRQEQEPAGYRPEEAGFRPGDSRPSVPGHEQDRTGKQYSVPFAPFQPASFKVMAENRSRMEEYLYHADDPVGAQLGVETAAFKPVDPTAKRSGEDLMREARTRAAHVDVPDVGGMEVTTAGGSVFSMYNASERGGAAMYEAPAAPTPSGMYRPVTWSYMPTVKQDASPESREPGHKAGEHVTVTATCNGQMAEKRGPEETTFRAAPNWAEATAAAGLQYRALHEPGSVVTTRTAPLPRGHEHVQIYGIVSGDGKNIFIDKVPAGMAETAFRAHQSGANPLTAPMFQKGADAEGESTPVMALLADYTGSKGGAAGAVQAFAKKFQDSGMGVTAAGGALGAMKLDNMSSGGLRLYDRIAASPVSELLNEKSTLNIKDSASGLFPGRKGRGSLIIESAGIDQLKQGAGASGTGSKDKQESGKRADSKQGAVDTDSRAAAVKSAVDRFNAANRGTTQKITHMVRQYLTSSLTQGNEDENPFIELDKGWGYARKGMTMARAAAMPATGVTTAVVTATQRAVLEKAVYKDLSAAGTGFNRLYNNASARVARLQESLANAEASSSATAADLRMELAQAKKALHRMDKFKAMKSNSAAMVEASKAMSDSRGLMRHNLHQFDKTVSGKLKAVRDSVNTGTEFASMRSLYGKDLMEVTDKKLVAAMSDLKANGRNLRGQIKDLKLKLKAASPGDAARIQDQLKKLTADAKSNAANYNLHRKLMDKRTELQGLSEAAGQVRGKITRFRGTAKAGIKTTAGLFTGYLVRCAATSGDYGLNGISIISGDVVAIRAGASFVGRRTGLSRVTSAIHRKIHNWAADGVYHLTAPVRQFAGRVTAPVTHAVKTVSSSAISAAAHGTSVIATHAADAISKATPAGVKAAGVAAKGGIAAVKKAASTAANKLASSTVGKAALAAGRAVGHAAAAVGHVIGAIAGAIGTAVGVLMTVAMWILIIVLLVSVIMSIFDSGSETADGKIDLSEYDGYINESWADYQDELNDEIDPDDYGCESVEWFVPDTPSNKLVILTMLAVRIEYQTDTGAASLEDANVSMSEIRDYLDYITGELNPPLTYVDQRERQVWVSDGDGEGHYETEIYYVLQVSINPYTFTGSGTELQLINADGTVSLDSVDGYGTIPGSSWVSWDEDNRELCDLMYNSDWGELYTGLTGISVTTGNLDSLTADASAVLEELPEDLSPERRAVVETALSLVGKVNYFWGGKSLTLGWDSRWGTSMQVTAAGSSSTGSYRPFGLDCSGFVDWVFYNATNGGYIIGHGGGAHAQHGYCNTISWSDAMPGDLVFYPEDSHVGIVCGFADDGTPLIVHCASGQNNVVITGLQDFETIGRPQVYNSWTY